MNYDFVLRKCDPRMGKHLAVLADILSDTSTTIDGFTAGTFWEEDYLDALGQLTDSALLKFAVETGLTRQSATPRLADLILCQRLHELRETLRERLCGVEGSAEREKWEEETAAIGFLGDLVRQPPGQLPYPLCVAIHALSLLIDRVNEHLSVAVPAQPQLEPALAHSREWQGDLLALLLDPEFCPEADEDPEELDAEANA